MLRNEMETHAPDRGDVNFGEVFVGPIREKLDGMKPASGLVAFKFGEPDVSAWRLKRNETSRAPRPCSDWLLRKCSLLFLFCKLQTGEVLVDRADFVVHHATAQAGLTDFIVG